MRVLEVPLRIAPRPLWLPRQDELLSLILHHPQLILLLLKKMIGQRRRLGMVGYLLPRSGAVLGYMRCWQLRDRCL